MVRRLENILLAGVSVKMGRSKGRQAPTIPSDDSTMGQYTVGVSRSWFGQRALGLLGCTEYVHVKSSSPALSRSGKDLV